MMDPMKIEELKAGFSGAIDQMEKYTEQFNRNDYKTVFEVFLDEQTSWLSVIKNISEENIEEDGTIVADAIISIAETYMEQFTSKGKRDRGMLGLNMYMVTYIFPAILEECDRKSGKAITDIISAKWALAFKNSHIQAARYADIDGGFKRKLCYITTATCVSLNLGEDCEELKLLKGYRDQYLANRENGEEYIRTYYNIAPTIVTRINRSANPDAVYRMIYTDYLKPCIDLIKAGKNEECLALYQKMIVELSATYVTKINIA